MSCDASWAMQGLRGQRTLQPPGSRQGPQGLRAQPFGGSAAKTIIFSPSWEHLAQQALPCGTHMMQTHNRLGEPSAVPKMHFLTHKDSWVGSDRTGLHHSPEVKGKNRRLPCTIYTSDTQWACGVGA